MKALVLKEYNQLVLEDVAKPVCKPDELLVRVKSCAICGSDVQGMDGSTGRRRPPIIMGHEASGVIEAMGSNVKGFSVGDRITFDSTIYCGECFFCRRGQVNLCDHRRVLGVSCEDYRQNGALAEYIVIPYRIAYHLPENVSFDQAAMVEPVSIALHAVNLARIYPTDSAVVVGAGTIGLMIVQILKIVGCQEIIAVDIDPGKFPLAEKYGATACLKADDPEVIGRVIALTKGRGADLAFEAVGITSTVKAAVASLRKGGQLVLVGNLHSQVEFPLQAVVTRQIAVYGSCASSGEYPACLELIQSRKVDVDSLISATVPLYQGAESFSRLYAREPGLMKIVVNP